MRQFNTLVFDAALTKGNLSSASAQFSSPEYNALLGSSDTLVIAAVVDQVIGTAIGFTVQCEHSPDGRNWAPIAVSGTPEINNVTLNDSQTFLYTASVANAAAYVRLRVYFNAGTTPGAHVKIYATGRGSA